MSYQGIRDVYFIQKKAELMAVVYTILEFIDDVIRFPEKLLEKAGLCGNYERISLHALMA